MFHITRVNMQIYVNSLGRARSDLTEGWKCIRAARLRQKGRGFLTLSKNILTQNGIKLCHLFLARSPVIDSALMTWGNDELHQDFLGFCCKKMQKFMIKPGAPFGSGARRRIVDYWLALWRNQGITGLINYHRLFSSAQTTAKERRVIAECTPYLCNLFPEDIVLQVFYV